MPDGGGYATVVWYWDKKGKSKKEMNFDFILADDWSDL